MAKKKLLLKDLHDNLLKLKALTGFNLVINYYLDETDLMMMISFHKIDKYKDWHPLSFQFIKSDYDEDSSVMNTKIATFIKKYMGERVRIEKDNVAMKIYEDRIDEAINKFIKKNKLKPSQLTVGADVWKYLSREQKNENDLVRYKDMLVVHNVNTFAESIKVDYIEVKDEKKY